MEKPFIYPKIKHKNDTFYPYETIQIDVEENLHLFLSKKRDEIKTVVIVGAWHGDEVISFLKFPKAHIYCFEPQDECFRYLQERFYKNKRVTNFDIGCGEEDAEKSFYITDRTGNASVLKPTVLSGQHVKKETKIKIKKLDSISELRHTKIDLLWIDVQGYELGVLKGAKDVLQNTSAIFLEVGEDKNYQAAVGYTELKEFLLENNFNVVAEGIEVGGNVLFIHNSYNLPKTIFNETEERLKKPIKKRYLKRKVAKISVDVFRFPKIRAKIKKIIKW